MTAAAAAAAYGGLAVDEPTPEVPEAKEAIHEVGKTNMQRVRVRGKPRLEHFLALPVNRINI